MISRTPEKYKGIAQIFAEKSMLQESYVYRRGVIGVGVAIGKCRLRDKLHNNSIDPAEKIVENWHGLLQSEGRSENLKTHRAATEIVKIKWRTKPLYHNIIEVVLSHDQ